MVSIKPKIGLVSTGNELVDIDQQVAAHQTRRSNVPALRAALLNMGLGEPASRHFADDERTITEGLGPMLEEFDLVVLIQVFPMSAVGQKRTLPVLSAMSALPPKADIGGADRNVCF